MRISASKERLPEPPAKAAAGKMQHSVRSTASSGSTADACPQPCLFVEHGKELGGIGKENNSARPAVVELVLVAKWNWKEGGREGNA